MYQNPLEVFMDNTSTTEALIQFAQGGSLTQLHRDCWPEECKKFLNHIKQSEDLRRFRIRVRAFLTRRGWDWKD